jgi:ABC-type hemin transport system ATPase subunit
MTMLQIDNLHATVADKPILKGLSLTVNAGEIHAIMGPNGAGKSTLGYVLGGRPGYEVTGVLSLTPPAVTPAKTGAQPKKQSRRKATLLRAVWVSGFAGMTKLRWTC